MTKKDLLLYFLLAVGSAAGYLWLWLTAHDPHSEVTVCLFKNVTSLPCPSCGSSRAVVALANGDVMGAFQWNPIGFLIAFVLLVSPGWVAFDLVTKRRTLPAFAALLEGWVQKPWVYTPAVILVLVNWIWNFSKGL